MFISDQKIFELVNEFGTPLYVYDEATLRKSCRDMRGLLPDKNFRVSYSAKANSNIELLKIVRDEHAVVLARRVTDTIKQRSGEGRLKTLDRAALWAMETPQVFARDLITRAYARVFSRGLKITDDAAAVELLGHPVALLENPHPNPKLTTPADLAYFEFINASPGTI